MKKILFGIALLFTTTAFAANPPVDEKVSKIFNETFPNAENIKWYEFETSYEVLFDSNKVSCRIKYDLKGKVISVRRDYKEKDLSLYIVAKLKENYNGKKIFGVTEISSEEGVSYTIVLEDDTHWLTVSATASGNMNLQGKSKKG